MNSEAEPAADERAGFDWVAAFLFVAALVTAFIAVGLSVETRHTNGLAGVASSIVSAGAFIAFAIVSRR